MRICESTNFLGKTGFKGLRPERKTIGLSNSISADMYHEEPSSYIPTVPSAGAAEGKLNGEKGDLAKHDL
jgi:hypothetical protein